MIGKMKVSNLQYLDNAFVSVAKHGVDKVLGSGKRDWQVKILAQFADSQFSALTCPCGAGKSTAQVALAIEDVLRSRRLQLFVMPQTHISDGFFAKDGVFSTIQIKDTVYSVAVPASHNFCDDSSLVRLKKLLLADRKVLGRGDTDTTLSGLFAMTSYHALAQVWDMMTKGEREKAIHNLHLRLDESHHIAMGDDDENDQNKIGAICRHLLTAGDKTARITLTTATSFRGDAKDIFPPSLLGKFTQFKLDWLEHWQTIGIKDLDIEVSEFVGSPIKKVIKRVCGEKKEKHYIAVPPRNAGWRAKYSDDSAGVDALIAAIRKQWKGARILNLVNEEEQKSNKSSLLAEPKTADKESKFDVVITCMLGREGTDWVPCSRLHVTYAEGSVTLAVQTLGRLLRRFAGKTLAIARYYYPQFHEPENGITKAELLDDRKNALLVMTQCEEMFYPILFPAMPRDTQDDDHSHTHHMGSAEQELGTAEYRRMKDEFLTAATELGISGIDNSEELDVLIDEIMDDYNVSEEFLDAVHDTLRAIWLRAASPQFRGISIAFVREAGFAKLFAKLDDGDKTLVFKHGYKKMKQLRAIIKKAWDTKYQEVKARIKKASDWDLPENRQFKLWALTVKAEKAKGAAA